ncbi:MAG: hypothetical protein V3T70_03395, partial [Phycisphaerae bacterium]
IPLAITAALPLGLLWAKYGTPYESGYRYIFVGRSDPIAEQARGADGEVDVFALRFVPRNLYDTHVSPPRFEWSGVSGLQIFGQGAGTSLWIGSPLLLLLLVDVRRWWRDPLRRALFVCSFLVHAVLMSYHYTGHDNAGYARYTLDFTLIWLAIIAPYTRGRLRSPLTLACLAWSLFYFYMVR